jgi:hypothetical protein
LIQKLLAISTMALVLSTSAYSASISERFIELNKEFLVLVVQTDTCVQTIKTSGKDPKKIDNCKSVLKLERKDIDRLKQKFNKQLGRYKQREQKLSEEERSLTKKYVLRIKDNVQRLQKNVKVIFDKNLYKH